jgi:hypothetical protein
MRALLGLLDFIWQRGTSNKPSGPSKWEEDGLAVKSCFKATTNECVCYVCVLFVCVCVCVVRVSVCVRG